MQKGAFISLIITRIYDMKPNINAFRKTLTNKTFCQFIQPLADAKQDCPKLMSEGNKPLSFGNLP